jgi:hypothetical protein
MQRSRHPTPIAAVSATITVAADVTITVAALAATAVAAHVTSTVAAIITAMAGAGECSLLLPALPWRRAGWRRRQLAAIVLSVSGLGLACQGDFTRPAFDNPNDPEVGELPPTPVIIAIVDGDCVEGQASFDITWSISNETGIEEYQLYRSSSELSDPGELILHVPAGTMQVNDADGIEVGATYYYRVRAVDEAGLVSLRSASGSATAQCTETS